MYTHFASSIINHRNSLTGVPRLLRTVIVGWVGLSFCLSAYLRPIVTAVPRPFHRAGAVTESACSKPGTSTHGPHLSLFKALCTCIARLMRSRKHAYAYVPSRAVFCIPINWLMCLHATFHSPVTHPPPTCHPPCTCLAPAWRLPLTHLPPTCRTPVCLSCVAAASLRLTSMPCIHHTTNVPPKCLQASGTRTTPPS
jgi:hypothetical protein